MQDTQVSSVEYWEKKSGKNYIFSTCSEPLRVSNPPSYLPLENAKRLDAERFFGYFVAHKDISMYC